MADAPPCSYGIGIFHPTPGFETTPIAVKFGYNKFTRDDIAKLDFTNAPMTIWHTGIDKDDIVNKIPDAYLKPENFGHVFCTHPNASHRAVGVVLETFELPDGRWACTFMIPNNMITLQSFIDAGIYNALSLTTIDLEHPTTKSHTIVAEITITNHPVRPGCTILGHFRTRSELVLYKRILISTAQPPPTTMTTELAKQSSIDAALAEIPDDVLPAAHRKVIAAHYGILTKLAEDERAKVSIAQAEAKVANDKVLSLKSSGAFADNHDIYISTLEELANSLPEKERGIYGLKTFTPELLKQLASDNGAVVRHATQRIAIAASHHMMMQRARQESVVADAPMPPTAEASAKRSRQTAPGQNEPPVVQPLEGVTDELATALRMEFGLHA
jgi:hypothetical protein